MLALVGRALVHGIHLCQSAAKCYQTRLETRRALPEVGGSPADETEETTHRYTHTSESRPEHGERDGYSTAPARAGLTNPFRCNETVSSVETSSSDPTLSI